MKLVFSGASPFVRKVNVLLIETGQRNDVENIPVKTTAVASSPDVVAVNPIGKIPALIREDGPALYDSRVICRFLDERAQSNLYPQEQLWDVLTLESIADGIMDAAVLVTYEARLRSPEQQSDQWSEGQWTKAARGVAALDADWMTLLAGPLNMGQIAVGCALGYLDFRHDARNWRNGNDALAAWYADFSKRESMVTSAPAD